MNQNVSVWLRCTSIVFTVLHCAHSPVPSVFLMTIPLCTNQSCAKHLWAVGCIMGRGMLNPVPVMTFLNKNRYSLGLHDYCSNVNLHSPPQELRSQFSHETHIFHEDMYCL